MAACNNATAQTRGLLEWRCARCEKLVFFGVIRPGSELYYACHRCQFQNHWIGAAEAIVARHRDLDEGKAELKRAVKRGLTGGTWTSERSTRKGAVRTRAYEEFKTPVQSKAHRLKVDVDAALKVWEQKWERLEKIAGEVKEAEAVIVERRKRLDESERPSVKPGLRFDVFTRDRFRCRYCGLSAADGVVLNTDHVVPESRGGPTTLDNLVTSCWDCNQGKKAKMIDGLRELLAG